MAVYEYEWWYDRRMYPDEKGKIYKNEIDATNLDNARRRAREHVLANRGTIGRRIVVKVIGRRDRR